MLNLSNKKSIKNMNKKKQYLYCHIPLANSDLQDMAAAHRDIAQGVVAQALQKSHPLTLLAQTLTISKRRILTEFNQEQLILERVGLATTHGTAGSQLTSMVDGLDETRYWLRADPVYWQTGPEGVFVNLDKEPEMTVEQAQKLREELAPWLEYYGLELAAPHPNRWYIGQNEPFQVNTAPLSQVIGKDASDYMPTGSDAARWRQLLTELQMVLQQSPTNDRLLSEGRTPVNSLWLWGEGDISGSNQQHDLLLVSDDAYCQGLANYCGLAHRPMVTRYDELKLETGRFNKILTLHGSMNTDNMVEWQRIWLEPILADLLNKRIHILDIYLGSDEIYRIKNNWLTRRKISRVLSRNE